jgi:hypothetical protein
MAENSGVFLLQGEDALVPMNPSHFASEDDFQRLLARFPELLVGDQIDPENPRRWVLVKREQLITTGEIGAPLWSIDHVFLDQDGIPTLVEVKRQGDSRIRREVVGQMLDYAANCMTYWSSELLQSSFESTCRAVDASPDAVLSALLETEDGSNDFWKRVRTNLQARKIRLIFVADVIPTELRRIVEFLNEQMDPAEVLAIELRQFASGGLKTIVPTVYGRTQVTRKQVPAQRWDENSLFDKLSRTVGEKEIAIARAIYAWMGTGGRTLVFGTGKDNGSVYPNFKPNGVPINPAYLSSDGKLWLQFGALKQKPVFGSDQARLALMQRFNTIVGANLKEADLTKYPSISLHTIAADPEGETKILAALKWMEDQITQLN